MRREARERVAGAVWTAVDRKGTGAGPEAAVTHLEEAALRAASGPGEAALGSRALRLSGQTSRGRPLRAGQTSRVAGSRACSRPRPPRPRGSSWRIEAPPREAPPGGPQGVGGARGLERLWRRQRQPRGGRRSRSRRDQAVSSIAFERPLPRGNGQATVIAT